MGSCCIGKSCSVYHFDISPANEKHNKTFQSLEEKDNEQYEDMPLIQPEKFKGLGIKRMKAYKCDLKIDDLNRLREAFWTAKINENIRWHFLRQACLYDNFKSEDYLIQHGFWLVDGCINQCTDNTNYIYKIPNYCINDPYFEKELVSIEEKSKHDKELALVLSDSKDKRTEVRINERSTGQDLKEKYLEENKLDPALYNVRLFFGGNEIKDDHFVFQHKIQSKFKIQVQCCVKEEL